MQITPNIRTALAAFSATIVVAAGILAANLADRYAAVLAGLDTEVLLLFLPCCALVFAVIVEAIRITARADFDAAPPARPLAWAVLAEER